MKDESTETTKEQSPVKPFYLFIAILIIIFFFHYCGSTH
ncbi:hypothetical protein EV199_5546 [Pseudobacter ginsenosidimutans]|uniref:Uncharacterized protein n=1 Tax=Pseudobacter ginsenosidimutans TaxID=661488 RepID=A0A4V2EZP0_9BACT|nr:hypothetical protein EV199_5546 [Pseudobacter ginsenosidimutans]